MDLSRGVYMDLYHVWRRTADGYVYPSKGRRIPQTDSEHLGEFTEWPDALHFLLDFRGIVGIESHREQNCTRCWEKEAVQEFRALPEKIQT